MYFVKDKQSDFFRTQSGSEDCTPSGSEETHPVTLRVPPLCTRGISFLHLTFHSLFNVFPTPAFGDPSSEGNEENSPRPAGTPLHEGNIISAFDISFFISASFPPPPSANLRLRGMQISSPRLKGTSQYEGNEEVY